MAGGGSIKRKTKKRNTRVLLMTAKLVGVILELVKINIKDE